MIKFFKPGEKASASSQYDIFGPRGGRIGKERTIASTCKIGKEIYFSRPNKTLSAINIDVRYILFY